MSKRLFIWIGLIVLIGVISAAGWSLYVTFNRPVNEIPPPPVRGKIPQMSQQAPVNAIHRAKVPTPPVQEPAAMPASEEETPVADAQVTPAPPSRNADPAATDQSDEQTPMAPKEPPAPEPVRQDMAETPAVRSDAKDSMAMPSPEPPPMQSETTERSTSEPEPESLQAQQETPDPMSAKQPATSKQAAAPAMTGAEPEARQAAGAEAPADSQFTIQVGAYHNRTYAEDAMAQLSRKGYEAYILEDTDKKSRTWYMVRFGHFPTRQAAQWAMSAYQDKEQKKAIIARSGAR